jgi:type II secretion system protein J
MIDDQTRPRNNGIKRCSHGGPVTKTLAAKHCSQWSVVSSQQSLSIGGFTLVELLVSVGVLVLLVLLATQLLNSAATITTLGHKQMDADSEARQVLDRMALDFAQMVKRSDVDYCVKSSAITPLRNVPQVGNDWIAFYGTVPGYYQTGSSATQNSPVSLVSYRVNSQNRLERMGKGLVWNAVSSTDTPVLFLPVPLASPLPTPELPSPTPAPPLPTPAWPQTQNTATDWTDSEVIGPQIFRFEYYYLLKNGTFSDIPWNTSVHNAVSGMQDVSAIVVDVAVIDPKTKVLVTDAQLARLNGADGGLPVLVNYAAGIVPGQLLAQWRAALDTNTIGLPQPAISGIRLYERYFYLSPPTLLTP